MKSHITLATLALICTILSINTMAATRVAVNSDDWSSSSTWGGSSNIPVAGDSVVIPNNKTVTVSSTVDFRTGSATIINILSGGTLQMDNGKKIRLSTNSYVNLTSGTATITHGGGGSSTYIEVGGTKVWTAGTASGLTGPVTFPAGALPVVLTSFNANAAMEFVSITWSTASEINNNYFEVQRSADMIRFETISHVQGQGTTMNVSNYSVADNNPVSGTQYYRLVQVDFDGTTTISEAIAVSYQAIAPSLNIYPNPSTGVVFATLASETSTGTYTATITITDLSGKTVAQKEVNELMPSAKVAVLDGSEMLGSGFYMVNIQNGKSVQTIKLQVIK